MKTFSAILSLTYIFLSFSAYACPNLAGEYYCLSSIGQSEPQLDILTMKQTVLSDNPEVTRFSSSYKSIPGIEDTFDADNVGIQDDWGWITKCTADKVISLRYDHAAISELYLDKDDNLVRAENYNVVQTCSRKSH